MRTGLLAGQLAAVIGLVALGGGAAFADIAIKVGVLNDRSGVYTDTGGEGSVVAARMGQAFALLLSAQNNDQITDKTLALSVALDVKGD